MDVAVTHKTQDALFNEAQARKPDWSKGNRGKETAMSITVGINAASEEKNAKDKDKEEEPEEIITDFEPIFDF